MSLHSCARLREPSIALGIALAAMTWGVFSASVGFDFLEWDDNRIVTALLARGADLESRLSWASQTNATRMFTPVVLVFWGAVADVFGITATSFHVVGQALHVLNALLVYRLCLELLARFAAPDAGASSDTTTLAAFLAAGLWAVHPLRVEVVAWTAAQPYALATTTGLSALLIYLRALSATGRAKGLAYVASLGLFSAAAFSHPQGAALCAAFPALHHMHSRKAPPAPGMALRGWGLWLSCLPFFAIASWALSVATSARAIKSGAQFVFDRHSIEPASLLMEATKAVGTVGDFSFFHAWLPLHSTLVYEQYTLASWSSPMFLAGLLALLAIAFVAMLRWRKGLHGAILLLICHFSLCIPAAGPFVEGFRPADRYVYATSIVAAVAIAFMLAAMMRRERRQAASQQGVLAYKALSVTLVTLGIAMSSAANAMGHWRDTSTLMQHLARTAQDAEFRVYARVIESAYWVNRGEIVEARRALMSMVEPPATADRDGRRLRSLMFAFRFLERTGNCDQLNFIARQVAHELRRDQKRELDALAATCR